jgi:Flp pilus assembly pilin Flp
MKNVMKKLLKDENGMTMLEIIIGSTVLGGAALLVGYSLTAGFRGKTGDFVGDLENIQAISDEIDDTATYGYTVDTTNSNTGMAIEATGN